MNENMWNVSEIKNNKIKAPKFFFEEQCKVLSEITGGKIIARVSEYDGEYQTRYQNTYASTVGALIGASGVTGQSIKFNVQKKLGEGNDDEKFVYEFYITSKKTSKYKYRVCFLYYSVMLYPVGISLDKSIADELESKGEFYINSEEEFLGFLQKLLSSKRVTSVINNLLSLNE